MSCPGTVRFTAGRQAALLQSAESEHRPPFIVMLPPGDPGASGATFFSPEEPEDNAKLIALVDPKEKQQLLEVSGPIPDGLLGTEGAIFCKLRLLCIIAPSFRAVPAPQFGVVSVWQ